MTGRELIELLQDLDEESLEMMVVFSNEPLKFIKIREVDDTTNVGSRSYLVLR